MSLKKTENRRNPLGHRENMKTLHWQHPWSVLKLGLALWGRSSIRCDTMNNISCYRIPGLRLFLQSQILSWRLLSSGRLQSWWQAKPWRKEGKEWYFQMHYIRRYFKTIISRVMGGVHLMLCHCAIYLLLYWILFLYFTIIDIVVCNLEMFFLQSLIQILKNLFVSLYFWHCWEDSMKTWKRRLESQNPQSFRSLGVWTILKGMGAWLM